MLKDKRQKIIKYVKDHKKFLEHNYKVLDIYEGNLRKYVEESMQQSLSAAYFNAIQDRILPINVLQRFTDKVSNTYSKPPMRTAEGQGQAFVDHYAKTLDIDVSGGVANTYATLHKGFAWEPYIDKNGKPQLRELAFDKFLVMSDSEESPDEETVFIKLMGKKTADEDSLLLFVYTDEEFDAFYLNGATAPEYLEDNQGLNPVGTIPYVYGKRQKNKLIPTLDTDILAISKAVPIMLSDAAGAQMFQCFSILWAIDVDLTKLKLSPNAIWDIKSDRSSDKNPQVGSLKPEASTADVVSFVINCFVLWLETKGVRVGSIGSIDGANAASGIAKIIDEMDVNEIKKKSQAWFKRDEEELFNRVLPAMNRYWLSIGVDSRYLAPQVDSPGVVVAFEEPTPMLTRQEEIANIKAELDLGTMTREQAIKKLHPKLDETEVAAIVNQGIISALG